MYYEFPANITLDDVRTAIKNANERLETPVFIEIDRGDHLIFNYAISFNEVWQVPETGMDREHAILRECRGLTFMKDGRIVARKFHKFFNVNEKPETQLDKIDWSVPHVILEKLDGSMITPFEAPPYETDSDMHWCTKLGMTEVAEKVKPFIKANPHYNDFARKCLEYSLTPMFEFCSMKQRIVIAYPKDRLVLTAIRNNLTGEYYTYEQCEEFAHQYNIELVKKRDSTNSTPSELIEYIRSLENEEGVVVSFENGHKVKIKADQYCMIHGTVSDIVSEKKVINMIVEGNIDDAIPLLPEDGQKQVEDFVQKFNQGISETISKCEELAKEGLAKTNSPAEFAGWVNTQNPLWRNIIFHAARGKNLRDSMTHMLSRNIGTNAKIDEVRELWGGHVWEWNGTPIED